jgi:hypothetical protein
VVFEAATSERSKLEREGGLDLVDLMDASARTTFLATLLRWITARASLGRNDDRKSPREFDRARGSSFAAVQPSLRRDPLLKYIVQGVCISLVGFFHFQRVCQVSELLQDGIFTNLTRGLFKDLSILQI